MKSKRKLANYKFQIPKLKIQIVAKFYNAGTKNIGDMIMVYQKFIQFKFKMLWFEILKIKKLW